MKSFEDELLNNVQADLDALQFVCKLSKGVDHATGPLLNMDLTHLEDTKIFACLIFIDFSSILNCFHAHFWQNVYNRGVQTFITESDTEKHMKGWASQRLRSIASPKNVLKFMC